MPFHLHQKRGDKKRKTMYSMHFSGDKCSLNTDTFTSVSLIDLFSSLRLCHFSDGGSGVYVLLIGN